MPGGKFLHLALRPVLLPHPLRVSCLGSSSLMAPALQIFLHKLNTLLTGPTPLTDSCESLPNSNHFPHPILAFLV